MTPFELAACLLVLAALFGYLNHTWLKFPPVIGIMALSLGFSFALVLSGLVVPAVERQARTAIAGIDLNQTFLHGMLGFMLFAGSLHINLDDLAARKWTVALLSTLGVIISTVVVGFLTWGLLDLLGMPARLIYCLLFGALISPTDPIAVMAILRSAGVPKDTETKIAGESLFNDGVGVVVFLGILEIATSGADPEPGKLILLFVKEAIGGAVLGFALGWLTYRLLRSVDNYQVEVLLSLALVAGGYALADRLHVSGPIAMVIAGLLIGNVGRSYAMSPTTTMHLDTFWELIDETLNAVLFVLIGLEVLVLAFTGQYLVAGLLAVPVVLLGRLASVLGPVSLLKRRAGFPPHTVKLLTWGGLRGGISVALALSIPAVIRGEAVPERDVLVALTYVVVVFSILVQGMTVGPLARRWVGKPSEAPAPEQHTSGDGGTVQSS